MTKSPAFQFYPKDWLSSRNVQLMTPAQEGAYIRLLSFCWDSGDCSLPDDDEQLAILSRLGEGWFNGGSTVVRKCFIPHPAKPGHLSNQRLLQEAEKQAAWQRKSAEGGKKSAAKRAEKKEQSKGGSELVAPNANSSSSSASASASSSAVKIGDDDTRGSPTPFQRVYDFGCELFPQLVTQNTSVIYQWLTGGADPDLDILPELKRLHDKNIQPKGWGLFTHDIANAKLRRETPLPKGELKNARSRTKHTDFADQDYRAGTEGFIVS